MPSRRRRRRPWLTAVVLLAAFSLTVGAVVVALDHLSTGPPPVQRCVAELGGQHHSLEVDQAETVALFAGIAAERGLPPRAVTIAIATAMQESRLRNIDYGDRDSLGLFQQRPSQGWGTEEQVMDPVYATNAFYDGLVAVDGYQQMEVTVAAQEVQRSAFPDAYAQHEAMARAFASGLAGQTPAGITCTLAELETNEASLILLADAVEEILTRDLPSVALDTAAEQFLILDATGLGADPAEADPAAWAVGQWAVATAYRTGASEVVVDGHRWQRGSDSWTEAAPDDEPLPAGHVLVR